MKRGRPHEDKDLKEKRISSEFLQFTVFVAESEAWGTCGHLVSQMRRVILYLICLKFICTNILILMKKHKSLCVVSTCPLPPGSTRVQLTVVRAHGVKVKPYPPGWLI